jgi:predicted glycosyltransferase
MDEILVANFMVFHDLIESEHYDAWLVDEGWDVDYFLHENPELKKAPYFWMTDFVGWLPMPDGGTYEADLASDYNADMIEHIDRLPWVRDHAIFVGDPADVVPDTFGSGMPAIRNWCKQHFSFTGGYITGFDPPDEEERQRTRRELGVAEDELLCIVTVGGSGVGRSLIEAVATAYPAITRNLRNLRMLVVSGPRLDPVSLRVPPGVEVVGYVHDLHRALAACDIAVVQGGLTTTMELTAAGRPFLYFPLRHHFEQNFHVTHRLDRYGAGRRMSFEDCAPDVLADAIIEELSKKVDYLPVDPSGAGRVADLISAVL